MSAKGAPRLDEFLAWLDAHTFEIVGVMGVHSVYADPICIFLRSRGLHDVTVGNQGDYEYLDDENVIREVEGNWLAFAYYEMHRKLTGAVTGAQVLTALDNFEEFMYNIDNGGET